jgi:PAS domain S-box-containing protein
MGDVDEVDRTGPPAGRRPAQAEPGGQPGLLELLVASVLDYAIVVLGVDGEVSSWNLGAERQTGWTSGEILGRSFAAFYDGADVAVGKPDRELAIAAADGTYEDQGWRVRKDGSSYWADVVITALRAEDGRLVGFGLVTRDLTERRLADEQLRESEERFRLLVSSVSDYAIFLLDNDGRIASWNLGAERLKGYRADEIIGRSFADFYTEADRREGVPTAALEHARAHGRWAAEGWRVRKDGSLFWASVLITRLVGADGTPKGFAKVTRDLTDRKRNEDALLAVLEREREAAERLRELDRMRSDLVSTVAHDLRAPIGVAQSYLHLLRSDWERIADDDRREMIDRLAERVDVLAALADDVFDMVRIDAGRLELDLQPFDLGEVIDRVVVDARAAVAGVELAIDAEPQVFAVGDRLRTWQILTNLVSNAVKFAPAGTTVAVSAARIDGHVSVEVADEGPGIPDEQHEAIFERFTRLPSAVNVPGSGLGLFIARSLADRQGGSLEVRSHAGEGAVFELRLPAAPRT